MAGKGGNGILNPPSDGDDVAPVIPLRQRQGGETPKQVERRPLPRERAAFDPEIESGDSLQRSPRGQAISRLASFRATLRQAMETPRQRLALGAVATGVMFALAALVLQPFGSSVTRKSAASSIAQHSSPAPRPQAKRRTAAPKRPAKQQHKVARRRRPASSHRSHMATRSVAGASSYSPPATAASSSPTSGTAPASLPSQAARSSAGTSAEPASNSTTQPAFGASGALGPGSSPTG
jgi:hypothetical protein